MLLERSNANYGSTSAKSPALSRWRNTLIGEDPRDLPW